MHTQAGQREAGDYEDGDIHEDTNYAARSSAKGKEEAVRVKLAPPLGIRPALSLPRMRYVRPSTITTLDHFEYSSRPNVASG